MDEIWKQLAASGPLALVLGVAVWALWRKVNDLAGKLESATENYTKRLETQTEASTKREDELRKGYEAREDALRKENRSLWQEINNTLKGLIE